MQQQKQSKTTDVPASESPPQSATASDGQKRARSSPKTSVPEQSPAKDSSLSSKSPAEPKLTAIERRKAMEERLRNRGKRKAADTARQDSGEDGESDGIKKARTQTEEEYIRQVRKAESKSLKDSGSGVRSLVK